MLRKLLASTAIVVAFSTAALAADLPSQKGPPAYVPPPPVFTWTGVYVGAQIGYQWGTQSTGIYSAPAFGNVFLGNLANFSPSGVVGGAHAGYNYQINQFVVGLEGDVEGSSYSGSQTVAFGLATLSTRENIEGSIRGRVGVAWDRALVYATGGAAIGSLNNTYNLVGTDSIYHTRLGWTVGGGVEYAIDNNWSIRVGYRYTDYGSYSDILPNSTLGLLQARVHETDNAVRVGFSYKFDSLPLAGPVVGRY